MLRTHRKQLGSDIFAVEYWDLEQATLRRSEGAPLFGGEVVRYEALLEDQVYVSRANDKDAKVPSYMGGKFPLSTYLAERVRKSPAAVSQHLEPRVQPCRHFRREPE